MILPDNAWIELFNSQARCPCWHFRRRVGQDFRRPRPRPVANSYGRDPARTRLRCVVIFFATSHLCDLSALLTYVDSRSVFVVHLSPLTTLEVDDATMLCLDWGSDKILATGVSNGASENIVSSKRPRTLTGRPPLSSGRIATWDVKSLIHSGEEDRTCPSAHSAPLFFATYARFYMSSSSQRCRSNWSKLTTRPSDP